MRILQISTLFFIFSLTFSAQAQNSPEIGEKLIISNSTEYGYSDIDLPKANFILKKNGRLNYGQLVGKEVVVHKIRNKENETEVVLKLADGDKFFGSFPTIKADYNEALKSGELRKS